MKLVRAFVFAVGLTCVAPAFAAGVDPASATPVQREQAQARFVRGRQLFDAKQFDAALAEFRASHDIVASPNSRLYVGRTLHELGRNVEAYVELGRAEVEARELTRADNRYQKAAEAAADERTSLRKLLGFVAVKLSGADAQTKLVVAGEEIRRGGWDEPIPVQPGTTEIRVLAPGHEPVVRSVTLEAGGSTAIDIDALSGAVVAQPAGPAPVPEPEKPGVEPSKPMSLRPFAIASAGVAVLGFATFTAFGLMAKGTHDDLESRCLNGKCPTDPSDDVSSGRTQQTIANVGLVVGGVGLIGAGVLFFAEPKRSNVQNARIVPVVGLGRVGVEGTF